MDLRTMIMIALAASACGDSDAAPTSPGKTEGTWTSPTTWPARPKSTVAPAGNDKLVPVPKDIAAGVQLVEVARDLARPVALVAAPGDARKRLFICEQHAGTIRILENGKVAPAPFLTVKNLSTGNEQGLLGLAFHPKFATNGRLYVHYTSRDMSSHIVEYKVSAKNPDAVDEATRREIIEISQPYSNHNGGHLLFGPDGKLYTGMGDGGSAGDPKKNGQNDKALLAKILKFDVDAATPVPEIVHMGVRNPWRFAFDEKTRGLYIGDVGQNLWEYVWVVPYDDNVRHNFGWNIVEGSHCYGKASCDRTGFTAPAAEYSHDEGCSITGGYVYRGKALPKLDGRYFYADYCTGLVRSFLWTADDSSPTSAGFVRDHWNWKGGIDRGGQLNEISSFGVDHDGELYILKLTGTVFKLAPKS